MLRIYKVLGSALLFYICVVLDVCLSFVGIIVCTFLVFPPVVFVFVIQKTVIFVIESYAKCEKYTQWTTWTSRQWLIFEIYQTLLHPSKLNENAKKFYRGLVEEFN